MKKDMDILGYGIPLLKNTSKELYKDVITIIQKAKLYNIPMFQNEEIANMLITSDMNNIDLNNIADLITWLNNVEDNAQASR